MERSRKETHGRARRKAKRPPMLPMAILMLVIAGAAGAYALWPSGEPANRDPAETAVTPGSDHAGEAAPTPDAGTEPQPAGTPNSDASPPPASSTEVRMTFVGDVIFAGNVKNKLLQDGFDYPYEHVKELLQSADLTIANLETPVTNRGEPEDKQYAYQSPPEALDAFKKAGFDLVSLANNHIRDYGAVGLLDTIDHLDQAGILHVGAGRTADEAYAYELAEINGLRIAFLSFSRVVPHEGWKARNPSDAEPEGNAGVAETYDYREPVRAIEAAEQAADLVVVLPHWGIEREHVPADHQLDLARRYIDAGADLIVGNHPHVVQTIEQYKGKWIAYSLGNFLFTTNAENQETWDSVALEVRCSADESCDLKVTPLHNQWMIPKPMDAVNAEAMLAKLKGWSPGIDIDAEGRISPARDADRREGTISPDGETNLQEETS